MGVVVVYRYSIRWTQLQGSRQVRSSGEYKKKWFIPSQNGKQKHMVAGAKKKYQKSKGQVAKSTNQCQSTQIRGPRHSRWQAAGNRTNCRDNEAFLWKTWAEWETWLVDKRGAGQTRAGGDKDIMSGRGRQRNVRTTWQSNVKPSVVTALTRNRMVAYR